MKEKKRVELLAPAGNKEAFYGAIHAGADAVYLGGSRFGARAYADNFTEDELISCIRYAHLWGRKVYLTVNTLVKESEFDDIYGYLRPFYEAGLDGVIVQDIGVFDLIREYFPQMELHVSTQMTITGKYGANLLKDMGACRVVPARELTLNEIRELKNATGMEIECFIHGAMCYCYSGQCLFSSILGGRSGNRGRCAQPCRLPYRVQKGNRVTDECYPLSLKDMCTIEHIPELIDAGIDSFKIEGRMKKAEYAAGVTAIYRKYIDRYYEAPENGFHVEDEDMRKLSCLYIRSERQDGYYHKHNGKEMVTLKQPSYNGNDDALIAEIRRLYIEKSPRIPITIRGCFQEGKEARVTFSLGELSVTVEGQTVQAAQKQPISHENIEKQLKKLGDSIFYADTVEVTLDEQVFYSLKEMNELRRKAVMQLENSLIEKNGFSVQRKVVLYNSSKIQGGLVEKNSQDKVNDEQYSPKKNLHVTVNTAEQLRAVLPFLGKTMISRIYLNGDLLSELQNILYMTKEAVENDCEIVISLPYILRSEDEAYLTQLVEIAEKQGDIFRGFQVRCLEAVGYLKDRNYHGRIDADAGFYLWNRRTISVWEKVISGFCIPYELKSKEQRALLNNGIPVEKLIYGRIPMMITANCVARTTGECFRGKKAGEAISLVDRYQKKFPIVVNCKHCMNIIYNSLPLSLHKEYSQWANYCPEMSFRLDFTVEKEEETSQILDYFHSIIMEGDDGCERPPYKEYTTGHEKRGVE